MRLKRLRYRLKKVLARPSKRLKTRLAWYIISVVPIRIKPNGDIEADTVEEFVNVAKGLGLGPQSAKPVQPSSGDAQPEPRRDKKREEEAADRRVLTVLRAVKKAGADGMPVSALLSMVGLAEQSGSATLGYQIKSAAKRHLNVHQDEVRNLSGGLMYPSRRTDDLIAKIAGQLKLDVS